MKNKIILISILFVGAYSLQSCSKSNNDTARLETDSSMSHMAHTDPSHSGAKQMDHPSMHSMIGTMAKMDTLKMTGDYDLDFVNMMIIHHQAAIAMSEVEVINGIDAKIKTMAQNIITAQRAEINQMEQFAKNYKMPKTKSDMSEMHNEFSEMMREMRDSMKNMHMSGNVDKDFVMMMIPHHETAVTMAEAELKHGNQSQVKKMAKKMIIDQTKEITEFKAWLSALK